MAALEVPYAAEEARVADAPPPGPAAVDGRDFFRPAPEPDARPYAPPCPGPPAPSPFPPDNSSDEDVKLLSEGEDGSAEVVDGYVPPARRAEASEYARADALAR